MGRTRLASVAAAVAVLATGTAVAAAPSASLSSHNATQKLVALRNDPDVRTVARQLESLEQSPEFVRAASAYEHDLATGTMHARDVAADWPTEQVLVKELASPSVSGAWTGSPDDLRRSIEQVTSSPAFTRLRARMVRLAGDPAFFSRLVAATAQRGAAKTGNAPTICFISCLDKVLAVAGAVVATAGAVVACIATAVAPCVVAGAAGLVADGVAGVVVAQQSASNDAQITQASCTSATYCTYQSVARSPGLLDATNTIQSCTFVADANSPFDFYGPQCDQTYYTYAGFEAGQNVYNLTATSYNLARDGCYKEFQADIDVRFTNGARVTDSRTVAKSVTGVC